MVTHTKIVKIKINVIFHPRAAISGKMPLNIEDIDDVIIGKQVTRLKNFFLRQ
jgi:hypothetical protein